MVLLKCKVCGDTCSVHGGLDYETGTMELGEDPIFECGHEDYEIVEEYDPYLDD